MGLATADAKTRTTSSTPRPRLTLRRYRWFLLVPALYTGLTVVLLWPLVAHLRTAVADTVGDPLLNAWTLRWVQHALVTDPLHLYDGNMFAPNVRSLAFSELLLPQAIMAWPVWIVTHDALLAYNLSILVTYPLCAVAMYALCRALGANRGGSFLAGLCFAFAPFRFDSNAHLQVLSMQWMPLCLLAIIRYTQRPTRWRFLAVSATVILFGLSSVYYLMMFGTGLAIFLVVEVVRQRGSFFARRFVPSRVAVGLFAALAIAAAITIAIDLPYETMRREQHIVRTLDEAFDDSAHADSYLTVTPGNLLWHRVLPVSGPERSALFPGVVLLICAAAGLGSLRKPWLGGIAGLGAVSFVLSFGPTWADKQHGAPLPYRFLYEYVIGYKGIRGPDRFAAVALVALCALAALGATRTWRAAIRHWPTLRRYATAMAVAVACLALAESATRLLPTVPVDRSATTLAPYQWLATQANTGIVAEFPVETTQFTTSFYSTYHWQKILWGHSGFIPAPTYQLHGRFSGRDDYPGTDDVDALADMGVGTILIHRAAYPPEIPQKIRAALASVPANVTFVGTIGDCDIYRLTADPAAPPLTASVTFSTNPLGNLDKITGTVRIENRGLDSRMLFTHGQFDLGAEIRDASGHHVAYQPAEVILPAIIPTGITTIPLTLNLPRTPGTYTIDIRSSTVPILENQPLSTVNVVGLTALPHLTLAGSLVTSPPLYTAGEPVAMWVTTKDGKSTALRDTVVRPDGTLSVSIPALPDGATQIVAHGKMSGVELWVSPP